MRHIFLIVISGNWLERLRTDWKGFSWHSNTHELITFMEGKLLLILKLNWLAKSHVIWAFVGLTLTMTPLLEFLWCFPFLLPTVEKSSLSISLPAVGVVIIFSFIHSFIHSYKWVVIPLCDSNLHLPNRFWVSFAVLVGISYVSVKAFCQVSYFLAMKYEEYFVCFRYKIFVRYVPCKHFSLIWNFYFHPLSKILYSTKVLKKYYLSGPPLWIVLLKSKLMFLWLLFDL